MRFVSNKFRKCRRCDLPVKLMYDKSGRFKGYYETCGGHPRPRGPELHNWKGGRTSAGSGYVQVLDPRRSHLKGASRYILEHRLVMETTLGRPLESREIVHHLNGVRDDNRPENLMVIAGPCGHETWTKYKLLQARIRELETRLERYVDAQSNS